MSQTKSHEKTPYEGYPYVNPIRTTRVIETKSLVENQKTTTNSNNNTVDRLPYHGYPYVQRIVTDAPTLNPDEVAARAKWQNLPRKLMSSRDVGTGPATTPTTDDEPTPVVYIDLPEESSAVTRQSLPLKPDLDPDRPMVYIDIPGNSGSSEGNRLDLRADNAGRSRLQPKPDLDLDRPVVYIDIPENNGSGVSQSIEEEEPAYVQDTILYDQFKDCRIQLNQDSDAEGSQSTGSLRPDTLDLSSPTGSSGINATSSQSSYINYPTKETYIYGQTPVSDEFTLSPLPVSDYPAYPPPYETIDPAREHGPVTEQPATQVRPGEPMTQVITSPTTAPAPIVFDDRRKLVVCQHCNSTVQTVVDERSGFCTHVLALLFCIFMFPLVLVVYCTNVFKYRNHFCPVCNKMIGYQDPASCGSNNMTYVS